jgi:hypothetical protein
MKLCSILRTVRNALVIVDCTMHNLWEFGRVSDWDNFKTGLPRTRYTSA